MRTIRLVPERMVILRYPKLESPGINGGSGFFSLVKTADELSIVMEEASAPKRAPRRSAGWRLLAVQGPFDLRAVGVLASITAPLAAAGVSIFALATFDTDYFLVSERQLARAVKALEAAGHTIVR